MPQFRNTKLDKKTMKSVKGVIFDMDGVIVDNHHFHVLAWEEFCKKHNIDFEEQDFRANYFGKVNFDILTSLTGKSLSPEQVETLGEEKESIYRRIYKDHIKPVHGLEVFLSLLKQNEVKIAVASSAPISNIDFVLDHLNFREYFDAIIDASMVVKGKPDPEIYLKAIKAIDVHPTSCVVFEDSVSGIQSGLGAGAEVIALLTTHSASELPKTSLQIKDFTDVRLIKFLNL